MNDKRSSLMWAIIAMTAVYLLVTIKQMGDKQQNDRIMPALHPYVESADEPMTQPSTQPTTAPVTQRR
jgi:hypothetical protein